MPEILIEREMNFTSIPNIDVILKIEFVINNIDVHRQKLKAWKNLES
jgi:hypothetical protein